MSKNNDTSKLVSLAATSRRFLKSLAGLKKVICGSSCMHVAAP